MAEVFPQEILSNIIRFCIDDVYSVNVSERNTLIHHTTQRPCTVKGLPDVSDLRLVNNFFDEEVKAYLIESFNGNLELQAQGRTYFSAKSAQLFHPKRGHMSWMLPLVRELRVNFVGLGPAVVDLVKKMSQLKQVTVLYRSLYAFERNSFHTEADVTSGTLDSVARTYLRHKFLSEASKMWESSLQSFRAKHIRILVEMEIYEHLGRSYDNHVPFDSLWVFEVEPSDTYKIVHRATAPYDPLEL